MDEIKVGKTVSIKLGSCEHRGKVTGVMGEYATVNIKSLGKQITTKMDELKIVKDNKIDVEYSGHRGDEMEEFRKSLGISKHKFYVDICKIPSGSYNKMINSDNITVPMWNKIIKGKEYIESLDKNEIESYKPKSLVQIKLNGSKTKIDKKQRGGSINMDGNKNWIESYKEFIKSLSMAETLEFFEQVKTDSKRFEEMFSEIKEAII